MSGVLKEYELQIAKELTLAAMEKLDLRQVVSRPNEVHNIYVTEEVSKLFKKMCEVVHEGSHL